MEACGSTPSQPSTSASQKDAGTAAEASSPATGAAVRCVALFDCTGQADDELSFKEGQVLMATAQVNGWLLGYVEGAPACKGIFPEIFLRADAAALKALPTTTKDADSQAVALSTPSQPIATAPQKAAGAAALGAASGTDAVRCVALFDCTGQNADELNFKEGQVLMATAQVNGWLLGYVEGAPAFKGIFPEIFVRADAAALSRLRIISDPDSKGELQRSLSSQPDQQAQAAAGTSAGASASAVSGSAAGSSAAVAPTSTSDPPLTALALYDFEDSDAESLPFKAGDVLRILKSGAEDWWLAELNGRTGNIPRNHVQLQTAALSTPSQPSAAASQKAVGTAAEASSPATGAAVRCVALFDLTGQADDELSFKEGQVLMATARLNDWLLGYVEGVPSFRGIFPENYVRADAAALKTLPTTTKDGENKGEPRRSLCDPAIAAGVASVLAGLGGPNDDCGGHGRSGAAVALFDFDVDGAGELPLRDGDVLKLHDVHHASADWLRGQLADKRTGRFPRNHVQPLDLALRSTTQAPGVRDVQCDAVKGVRFWIDQRGLVVDYAGRQDQSALDDVYPRGGKPEGLLLLPDSNLLLVSDSALGVLLFSYELDTDGGRVSFRLRGRQVVDGVSSMAWHASSGSVLAVGRAAFGSAVFALPLDLVHAQLGEPCRVDAEVPAGARIAVDCVQGLLAVSGPKETSLRFFSLQGEHSSQLRVTSQTPVASVAVEGCTSMCLVSHSSGSVVVVSERHRVALLFLTPFSASFGAARSLTAMVALDLHGVAGVCVHDRVLTIAHEKDGVIHTFE